MANNKSGQNSNKGMALVIALVAVVVVLAGVIVFLLAGKPEGDEQQGSDSRATVVTEANVEEVVELMNTPPTAGHYTCQMNVEWSFEDSTKPSYDAYVANAAENSHTVYFDVLLNNGEMIYSSPYIPVGKELTGITLNKELAPGDYDAVVTYHLVDEEHKELSTVSVSVVLHIEQ